MKPCAPYFLLPLLAFAVAFGQGKKSNPCADPQSQAEINMCAGEKYKAADATLNQVYRQLVSMLSAEEKLQLKEAQSAWLKYRDTNCEFVADQYRGGSIRPSILGFCLAEMTQNRTTELRNQIKDRSD